MFPSMSNCANTENISHPSTNMFTDRQLDRHTNGRTPERSTLVQLFWSTSKRAKMSTVRIDQHCAKWLGYEMTRLRNDRKLSVCRWTCMIVIIFKRSYVHILERPGKYMYLTFAYCYQDCGNYMRRKGTHRAPVVAIYERNSMSLHFAAPWYLFL